MTFKYVKRLWKNSS